MIVASTMRTSRNEWSAYVLTLSRARSAVFRLSIELPLIKGSAVSLVTPFETSSKLSLARVEILDGVIENLSKDATNSGLNQP